MAGLANWSLAQHNAGGLADESDEDGDAGGDNALVVHLVGGAR